MRIKNRRGGRSKPSRGSAASTPSPMASLPVSDRDVPNAEDSNLHEALSKETSDVLDKIDCFQKDTCTRCDKSGNLLVCTETGCPIALHEFCMSCEPSFDEDGRFYCPYCSYKRALLRVNELRRKTMVAKRALSDFIDTRMVGGGNSPHIGEAGKKKADDVSTCGVDVELPNHGSHLSNEGSRVQDMEVEQNQSNEGENRARTEGDVQPTSMVGVNSENGYVPIVSNISSGSHSTPVVQPCEGSMNEETHGNDTSETHQVESLEVKEDGKTNDEIASDQGQLESPGAYHDRDETARESQDKDDGGEQIQPDNERMLEDIVLASGNNDLKNETIAKKRRFKSKANRRTDLQNVNSPRKSLRLQTPDPGKKSPHIQTPEPRKKSPRKQTPKPGKDHSTKIEKVSVSKKLKMKPASPNQFKNLDFHGGKRKRMRWSVEEEEMLKEGVHKFSSTANKNLPWRKILEFGHHIFDDTRTPIDLKDKWRNLLAK